MPKTSGVPALCGQETGLLGDDVTSGREPGGLDFGHKFVAKVRLERRGV